MPKEESRALEVRPYQRAEMIRKSEVMSLYRKLRMDTLAIEGNELLSEQERIDSIKKEFEKVREMLQNPEVERRDDKVISEELRAFIKNMAHTWVMYGVSDESRNIKWLITYEPTARKGDTKMSIFKRATYGYLADEGFERN